jgi:hypothetical protein
VRDLFPYHGLASDPRVSLTLASGQNLNICPRFIATREGKTLKVVGTYYDASVFAGTLTVNTDVQYDGKTWHAKIIGDHIVLKPVLK